MTVWTHFSPFRRPIFRRLIRVPAQGFTVRDDKPHARERGPLSPRPLWLSNEDGYGWSRWCRENEYEVGKLRYARTIRLIEGRGLVLPDIDAVLRFGAQYEAKGEPPSFLQNMIDWNRVQADGHCYVAIPRYLWDLRLDERCRWYYTWDCACAVVWDPDGIESLGRWRETTTKEEAA